MGGPVLDQAADGTDAGLFALASVAAVPAYVKRASAEAVKGHPGLADTAFADPRRRAWPFHTKAATWASCGYYLRGGGAIGPAAPEPAGRALARAADYWGIADDVAALAAALAGPAKAAGAAGPGVPYAFEAGGARHLRMADAGETKLAAAYLRRYRDAFEPADRRAMAGRILDRAAELGVAVAGPEELEKMAGRGLCGATAAAGLLAGRAAAVAGPGRRSLGEKLAALARSVAGRGGVLGPDEAARIADAVEAADRAAGLDRDYGRGVARPEDVLFGVSAKAAAELAGSAVRAADGALYRRDDLEAVRLDRLARYDPAFAESVAGDDGVYARAAKLAAALPRLGRAEAAAVGAALGVAPAARQPAPPASPRLHLAELARALA